MQKLGMKQYHEHNKLTDGNIFLTIKLCWSIRSHWRESHLRMNDDVTGKKNLLVHRLHDNTGTRLSENLYPSRSFYKSFENNNLNNLTLGSRFILGAKDHFMLSIIHCRTMKMMTMTVHVFNGLGNSSSVFLCTDSCVSSCYRECILQRAL